MSLSRLFLMAFPLFAGGCDISTPDLCGATEPPSLIITGSKEEMEAYFTPKPNLPNGWRLISSAPSGNDQMKALISLPQNTDALDDRLVAFTRPVLAAGLGYTYTKNCK